MLEDLQKYGIGGKRCTICIRIILLWGTIHFENIYDRYIKV